MAGSKWPTYVSPFNCLTKAFNTIMTNAFIDPHSQIWVISDYLLAMVTQATLLFCLAVYLDHRRVNGYKGSDGVAAPEDTQSNLLPENEDVAEHRAHTHRVWEDQQRPREGPEYLLEAKDVMKVYDASRGPVAAVMKNSFCVAKGEIFGLLGPNGAGKTSTFNMLTLAARRSGGDCRIAHTNIDELNIRG